MRRHYKSMRLVGSLSAGAGGSGVTDALVEPAEIWLIDGLLADAQTPKLLDNDVDRCLQRLGITPNLTE